METNSPKIDTLSLLQLIMGGLGVALAVTGALIALVIGATHLMGNGPVSSTRPFSLAAVAVTYSLLLLPSVILPLYRLLGKPLPELRAREPFRLATFLLFVWPALVLSGWFASKQPALSWFLMPVLSILTIGIPVWWLVEAGRRKLPGGSLQRSWGLLGYGVVPNVLLILTTELLAIVALVVAYGLYVSSRPDLLAELETLAQRIRAMGNDPQQIMQFAQSFFSRPGAVYAVIGVGAVLMPMIEEALKPLGLWFIARRIHTPAEGFNAGLICGGAFAFVESLNLANGMATTGWTSVVFARVGAGLLHVACSGLVGWGLASAWTEGRYLRQALTFLAAVALHGTWNFFGLLMGLWTLLPATTDGPAVGSPSRLTTLVGPAVLAALAALMLFVLLRLNARLRRDTATAVPVEENQAAVSARNPDLLVESTFAVPVEDAGEAGTDVPGEPGSTETDSEER